jgi:hypothetical protein
MIGHSAAAASEDELAFDTYVAPHFDTDLTTRFVGKDFILFPISDGYPAPISGEQIWTQKLHKVTRGPEAVKDSRGLHWSLTVVDCRGILLKARYLDSLDQAPNNQSINQVVAWYLLQGLQLFLNQNTHRYEEVDPAHITVEHNTSH